MFARMILLVAGLIGPATAMAQDAPLVIETKIPLGEVNGRIDHLGIDPKRQRLFVAELGNDSLGVVDLAAGKVLRTVAGFSEPQGVAYVSSADSIYVANGGDGSVRVLRGDDLAPIGRIELGDDADNVRSTPRVIASSWATVRARWPSSILQLGREPPISVSTAIPRVFGSIQPARGFLSTCRMPARSRWRTWLRGPAAPGRRRALHRTFQWRSTGTRTGFLSSFAARRS
jgi:hypothetical protein